MQAETTPVFLFFPLVVQKLHMNMSKLTVAKKSIENVLFGALALRVISHEVSSPSYSFWRLNLFYGDHFKMKGCQKATF